MERPPVVWQKTWTSPTLPVTHVAGVAQCGLTPPARNTQGLHTVQLVAVGQSNVDAITIYPATATPTPSNTPTKTSTPSRTPTRTATPSPTRTNTPSRTPTASRTPTRTATLTNIPTAHQRLMSLVWRSAARSRLRATPAVPTSEVWKFYYFAGAQRIALRERTSTLNTVSYLLSDHLGSTSLTVSPSGYKLASMSYTAWGETRSTQGTQRTDYQYTGQRLMYADMFIAWTYDAWNENPANASLVEQAIGYMP